MKLLYAICLASWFFGMVLATASRYGQVIPAGTVGLTHVLVMFWLCAVPATFAYLLGREVER